MADEARTLDYRDPEWLAEQLGVDKTTIYRYLQEGTLPGLQLGRKWLVSERQLIEFLDAEARRQTELRRKGLPPRSDRFDRFTERARQVLTCAQEEAHGFNHNYIGTEHLLLGLMRDKDGLGAKALTNLGVDLEAMKGRILQIIGRGTGATARSEAGLIGLTPRAKKAIDLAADEARRLNHSYIGTEHLLLGMLREGEGIAFAVLESLGVSLDQARTETVRLLMAGNPQSP